MAGTHGGRRPGAGRKPKARPPVAEVPPAVEGAAAQPAETPKQYDDPLDFLLTVMNDPTASRAERIRAAITVASYRHAKKGEQGKKGARDEAARRAAGMDDGLPARFAPGAPPRLRAVGG